MKIASSALNFHALMVQNMTPHSDFHYIGDQCCVKMNAVWYVLS